MIERGVRGMLPKNKLGNAMIKKMFVYAGDKHPHVAQQPQPLA
jgi:large subunit ribosomal protein L13